MPQTLNPAFDAIFKDAHTNHVFTDKPVSESTLRTLWDLSVLPPTAFNAQPARVVFVTSAEGKASSVQFIHFPFAGAEIALFRKPGARVVVGFDHPAYPHLTVMPEDGRATLAGDFD